MNAVGNREAALALAAAGLPIFPCSPDKKPIRGVFWRRVSTADTRQVDRWWSDHPEALPAIDLAKAGLIVIDADRHGGPDGVAAWEALADGRADDAPTVDTPSGGRHIYFRNPDGLGNGRGALPPGIDVRGAGGYVIGPGAELPDGRRYVPHGDIGQAISLPEWPAEVLSGKSATSGTDAHLAPGRPETVAPQGTKGDFLPASRPPSERRLSAYVEAGVDLEVNKVRSAGKGGRNNALNEAAFALGQMVGAGWLSEGSAQSYLEAAAHDSGLAHDDGLKAVRATIRSGLQAGRQKPREPLPDDPAPTVNGAVVARNLIEREGELIDAETGEVVDRSSLREGEEAFCFPASRFDGQAVPPRNWHVPDLIPASTVTLFGGDGGTGKSLLALQLAASTALRRPWLGFDVAGGRALYLSAEDDVPELHRRVHAIAQAEGVDMAALDDLMIAPMAGRDAVLAAAMGKAGEVKATKLFERLAAVVRSLAPALVILDTLADLFAGNENDRMQARQFVQLLRGIAIDCDTTIVLLSHPSRAGLTSGSGDSGSTAWNNSVRSRLYLARVHVQDGDKLVEPDSDVRVLAGMKSNYAQRGMEIRMRWQDGVFVADERNDTVFATANRLIMAERKFMELLRAYEIDLRNVSASGGVNFAPMIFARDQRAEGIGRRAFEQAMNTLFERGDIEVVEYGPPSQRSKRISIKQE